MASYKSGGSGMTITIIASLAGEKRALGWKGDLCFRIKEDLMRFRDLTMGHPIVMGRLTAESLKRSLPGRRNLVIGHSEVPGFECFPSLEDALRSIPDDEEVFIIGGGRLYKETLGIADRLELTIINKEPEHSDTFFPPFEDDFILTHKLPGSEKWYEYRTYRRKEV